MGAAFTYRKGFVDDDDVFVMNGLLALTGSGGLLAKNGLGSLL
jgi:hypothetical protein